MSLAEHYDKAAVAASQVVAGFDADIFQAALADTVVGVAFDEQAASSHEGQAILDLTVRLLARLYPALSIRAAGGHTADSFGLQLRELAHAVNPRIDFVADALTGITVGSEAHAWERTIYAGSDGWTGRISLAGPVSVADSRIPFGAGAAACLAASAVFRMLLDPTAPPPADTLLSCADGVATISVPDPPETGWALPDRTVLVGAGAIGQAAAWALARSPIRGTLHISDDETVDLGNMQRYVLTRRADVDQPKARFAADHINELQHRHGGCLGAEPLDTDWVGALKKAGHEWDAALAAVDSATARRAVQAALPCWVANAWTQPGDLGVSDHDFLTGACLACLYLPTGSTPNEDQLVADALGVPDLLLDIRTLLYNGAAPPAGLLTTIAARLGVDASALDCFGTRSIRDLYVEGVCGGAVLPLRSGAVRADVHVPLAHQSALAGVLLAARLVRHAAGHAPVGTEVTRLDVRRDPPEMPTQPAGKDPRGICLCQDDDYLSTYRQLWTR
jgi:Prokaryotic E2 family C/ThiF family